MKKLIIFLLPFFTFGQNFDNSADDYVLFFDVFDKNDQFDKMQYKGYTYTPGQPIFVIIYIDGSQPNEDYIAKREQKELEKNFNTKVDLIRHSTSIKFNNKFQNAYKFSYDDEATPKNIIYWSGKFNEKPIIYKDIINATEFFAPKLKTDFESSYKEIYRQRKDKILNELVDNPTQKSLHLSNAYTNNIATSMIYLLEELSVFFNFDFKGIKSIDATGNLSENDKLEINAQFKYDGKISSIIVKFYNQDNFEYNFFYKNHLLIQLKNNLNSNVDFYYNDDTLFYINDYRFVKTKLYKEKILTYQNYYFNDGQFAITVDEFTGDGMVLKYTVADHLNDKTYQLNSLEDYYPIQMHYRNDESTTFKKINSNELQLEFSDKNITYKLNHNLIEQISIQNKKNQSINRINYKYEYY